MKKQASPHPESESHVLCPFCETPVDRASPERLCYGCGVEWSPDASGAAVFDDSRKAGRAAVDEAARRDRARNASAGGLHGDNRRRPVRLGKKR
jgi:hypothetical protein